ncbi:hypothetical protein NEFER03_0819 [Nematocida sp. LUAm3]|nr:hypothetical protein NEFER03_0819 [Nematocida sp. LUAm3]KAI5174837.1 hypothetical protein NEFER02_0937 [Nematocida sp. LUAm2]KAI5177565.1 hypothetical protein NEFER01_0815 [Nematocida sp. LUAm1]
MVFVYAKREVENLSNLHKLWWLVLTPRAAIGTCMLLGGTIENLPRTGIFLIYISLMKIVGVSPAIIPSLIFAVASVGIHVLSLHLKPKKEAILVSSLFSSLDAYFVLELSEECGPIGLIGIGMASFIVIKILLTEEKRKGRLNILVKDGILTCIGVLKYFNAYLSILQPIGIFLVILTGVLEYLRERKSSSPRSVLSRARRQSISSPKKPRVVRAASVKAASAKDKASDILSKASYSTKNASKEASSKVSAIARNASAKASKGTKEVAAKASSSTKSAANKSLATGKDAANKSLATGKDAANKSLATGKDAASKSLATGKDAAAKPIKVTREAASRAIESARESLEKSTRRSTR